VREHLIHPRLGQVLRASRLSQRALRLPKVGGMPAVIVAPVMVGDEVPSYLVTIDPADNLFGEDMSLLVTEHAATICGVILGRERVVAAAARRVRDDLVEGLLLGRGRDNADASRWAAHLGYDPARDHNVLAIAFEKQSESDAMWALSMRIPFQPALVAGAGGYFAPHIRSYIRRSNAPDHVGILVAVKDRLNALKNPYAHLHITDISYEKVAESKRLTLAGCDSEAAGPASSGRVAA